jgi:flagellar biosynthesis protein FliP
VSYKSSQQRGKEHRLRNPRPEKRVWGYAGRRSSNGRFLVFVVIAVFAVVVALAATSKPASAQVAPVDPNGAVQSTPQTGTSVNTANSSNTTSTDVKGPSGPTGPAGTTKDPNATANASVNVDLSGALNKPSQSIIIIIVITLLSIAPSLLIMLTSFTRVIIVLTLTRNALGVASIPPNQVLVGLALFVSLFIMTPTFKQMNTDAVQPYLKGEINQTVAYQKATAPLKTFMLKQTRNEELELFINASGTKPDKPENVGMQALVPAFMLSEMKTAFIIGFVIFIPFLVIDIIVSSSLMSMGMMMLPPQMISMPFKLLLFVMVDGWALVIKSLLTSFN